MFTIKLNCGCHVVRTYNFDHSTNNGGIISFDSSHNYTLIASVAEQSLSVHNVNNKYTRDYMTRPIN